MGNSGSLLAPAGVQLPFQPDMDHLPGLTTVLHPVIHFNRMFEGMGKVEVRSPCYISEVKAMDKCINVFGAY